MWIDRRLAEQVLAAARQFPAVVVTGGRQTGKTTLLRHLFHRTPTPPRGSPGYG